MLDCHGNRSTEVEAHKGSIVHYRAVAATAKWLTSMLVVWVYDDVRCSSQY